MVVISNVVSRRHPNEETAMIRSRDAIGPKVLTSDPNRPNATRPNQVVQRSEKQILCQKF